MTDETTLPPVPPPSKWKVALAWVLAHPQLIIACLLSFIIGLIL